MTALRPGLANVLRDTEAKARIILFLVRSDLLHLRLVSRAVSAAISAPGTARTVFKILYAKPRNLFPALRQSQQALRMVGGNCVELVVKLCKHPFDDPDEALRQWADAFFPGAVFNGDDENAWHSTLTKPLLSPTDSHRAFCSPLPEPEFTRNEFTNGSDWPNIFKLLPNMETLTIHTGKHPGGVSFTPVSSALASLRIAFEASKLGHITTLRLCPIHIAYIPHLQWAGHAIGEAKWWAGRIMNSITELELQVLQPDVTLSEQHHRQIIKTFHSWLQSYAKTIAVLKFHWIGTRPGPHPFALHSELQKQHRTQPRLRFPELREVWIGRVKNEHFVREDMGHRAPKLDKAMLLRPETGGVYLDFTEDSPREVWDRVGRQSLAIDRLAASIAEDGEEHVDDDVLGDTIVLSHSPPGRLVSSASAPSRPLWGRIWKPFGSFRVAGSFKRRTA